MTFLTLCCGLEFIEPTEKHPFLKGCCRNCGKRWRGQLTEDKYKQRIRGKNERREATNQ